MQTIYVEREIRDHPRVRAILERARPATTIPIERYGEVFNRSQQNFRLQKKNPSLILAHKFEHHVLPAPPGYGIGGDDNFYFSHILNCPYDCRYCFLQGMYRSAHYVVFVNYEDFQSAILDALSATGGDVYFFSGYDGDSLALESITGFATEFLPFFEKHPRGWLELRTKSASIAPLLSREAIQNCVVAFSFVPEALGRALDHKVPSLERRIGAARKLAERGWRLGLRFDPMIYVEDFREAYRELVWSIFSTIGAEAVHSVSIGAFRMPRDYFHRVEKLYPYEPLFAGPLAERQGMVSYDPALEEEMRSFLQAELTHHVPEDVVFPCEVAAA